MPTYGTWQEWRDWLVSIVTLAFFVAWGVLIGWLMAEQHAKAVALKRAGETHASRKSGLQPHPGSGRADPRK